MTKHGRHDRETFRLAQTFAEHPDMSSIPSLAPQFYSGTVSTEREAERINSETSVLPKQTEIH